MTTAAIRRVAVTAGIIAVAIFVADLVLIAAVGAPADEGGAAGATIWTLGFAGAPIVGLVIAARRPRNRYGWLLLSFALLSGSSDLAAHYAEYAHATGRSGVVAAAMAESVLWPSFPMHLSLLLLFFPDGRLPSPRWRWLPRIVVACGGTAAVLAAWLPDELGVSGLSNPYAATGAWAVVVQAGVFTAVIAMFLAVVLAAGSLLVRWRRASGQERLQLRWFTWAAGLQAAVLVFTGAGAFVSSEVVNSIVFSAAMASLFAAIGIAVLRYRLYEIDRIISRTVTYAAVTVVVVAVYLAGVTLLTRITAPVTGDSPVAIAAATLAAAAVFRPARRRIQSAVDRRFNRSHYDAEQTAAAYRARLRDQLDIETISHDLVTTTSTAFEPDGVVLWLRTTGART